MTPGAGPSVRLLTPGMGEGAIAVLELWGGNCRACLASCLEGIESPSRWSGNLYVGLLRDGGLDVDHVVVRRASESRFEISLHGGRATRSRAITALVNAGARRDDRESEVARTRDLVTSARALDQLLVGRGVLESEVRSLHAAIREGAPSVLGIRHRLESLVARSQAATYLRRPPRVLLYGPPNVSKSSLANALLGQDRSLVTEVAGTTRDLVATRTTILGHPYEIQDSAGLHPTSDPVEIQGQVKAKAALREAEIRFYLRPAAELHPATDDPGVEEAHLVLATKADLLTPGDRSALPSSYKRKPVIFVSARTGEGVAGLRSAIHALGPFSRLFPATFPCPVTDSERSSLSRALAAWPDDPESTRRWLARLLEPNDEARSRHDR